jgi:hypothetical protein
MRPLSKATISALFAMLAIAFSPTSSLATVILNIDGNGQLTGARNVDVGGTLYNASFIDSTCVAIFDGCDSVSDFDFQTVSEANLAAQALLDQVLLDSAAGLFDSNPSLVLGIENTSASHLMVPFALPDARAFFRSAFNSNGADSVGNGSFFAINNTTFDPSAVWVDFTKAPVVEPESIFLLMAALMALFLRRRRQFIAPPIAQAV